MKDKEPEKMVMRKQSRILITEPAFRFVSD